MTPRAPARPIPATASFVPIHALFPLLAAAIWGGMYVVSKWSFAELPPVTLGFARMTLGGLACWLLVWRTGRAGYGSEDRGRFIRLGATVCGTIVTQFVGTDLATAAEGALLTTTTPAFVVLLAWLLLREVPTARTSGGTILAFGGVVVVVAGQTGLQELFAGETVWGSLLLLAAAAAWALVTVLGKPLVARYGALPAMTYGCLWSLPFFLPVLLWEVSRRPVPLPSAGGVFAILYLGLASTALAWYLWYKGLEGLPAGVVAVFFFAQPVVGGVLAWLFLGERLGAAFLLGGTVIASGILLAARE
ncbi:MAG: DMT family transporter [candidate division NC10 bacterium]|nr:DMT family transporter [candidate division NC10 bacterium]